MKRRDVIRGAGGLAASGLALPKWAAAQGVRTLKFIPHADLTSVDPVQSAALVTMMHGCMVYDMLYGFDSDYRPQPQMVEGHAIADDGKTWTLTLREGLKFHDGTPVLARDCVASIQRWGKRDGFGITLFNVVDELSAPSDKQIRFRLKKPFPLLPDALGKVGAYPCMVMQERFAKTEPTTQVSEVVGSGPYRFIAGERIAGARAVYQRFDGYVPRGSGTPSFLSGPKIANFDRVEWHGISTVNPAANNYIRGNGFQGMAGWPVSQKLEELRLAWLDAPDLESQKKICRELQLQCFEDVPHFPVGLYYQATAFRANLDGVLNGIALFYNVKRS